MPGEVRVMVEGVGVVDVNVLLEENARLRRTIVAMDSGWTAPPNLPPQLMATVQAFLDEYWRAKRKHGEMTMDGTMSGDAVRDDALRLAALVEEVGEVAHELTYDSQPDGVEGGKLGRLMKELIQVMNIAGTWYSYLVPGPTAQMPAAATEPEMCPQAPTVAAASGWGRLSTDSEARTEDHHPGRGGW